MHKDKSQKVLSILVIIFLITFLAVPIITLFTKAFQNVDGMFIGIQNFTDYLSTRGFKIVLRNSLKVSCTSTVISIIFAFIYAYGINRTNIKFKGLLHWLALLPLFAPTMTHGISLIYLFGNKGILTNLFNINFEIYGFWGITISEAIYVFPAVYLMFSLALKNTDNRLYEAAEVMGTSAIRKFLTITIPSIKFALITAFFSAFTMTFTDFGAPKIIGGNYNVLATEVYKKMLGQQDLEMGSVVGVILIIPAIIAFIVDFIVTNKNKVEVDSKATKYVIHDNKSRDISIGIINIIIGSIILILFATIVLSAIVTNWPYDLSITRKWFSFDVMGTSGFKIFGNSIFVAFLSAIFGTMICFIAAYLCERSSSLKFAKRVVYFMGILPNAIPGLTIGIAFMFFFNKQGNPLGFLYGTFAILILANIIHFFATPFLTMTNEMKKIDKEYENASEMMGVPWYGVIRRVIIPLSLPAILESFSYYFVNSMMTVSAVVFLYFPTTRLATISMINKADIGEMAAASAVAVMIIITNIVFRVIFDKLSGRLRKNKKLSV
ncbi:MAG: putative 2-aminoethylphosphonate ABC transporter permease subunit [Clostridium sp.]|uniref:putative 2-aminoethylphosphonate ABC transporter permease subunit n=1 Tax=Clostridium sp. TaxID=1506 RepID=UPI002914FBB6|nr:putative 2-aminoethylphosphonate ABC transporter permease subunit [Clostridium sp.]MDU4937999.1 putative 2-aminoethylphosphonate ABC transporter permease subunit [Clostridium sp.]